MPFVKISEQCLAGRGESRRPARHREIGHGATETQRKTSRILCVSASLWRPSPCLAARRRFYPGLLAAVCNAVRRRRAILLIARLIGVGFVLAAIDASLVPVLDAAAGPPTAGAGPAGPVCLL